jgi:hypothetical protein
MKLNLNLMLVAIAATLAACGGGGSDDHGSGPVQASTAVQSCCKDAVFNPATRTFTEIIVPIGQAAGPGRLVCKADSAHWACA